AGADGRWALTFRSLDSAQIGNCVAIGHLACFVTRTDVGEKALTLLGVEFRLEDFGERRRVWVGCRVEKLFERRRLAPPKPSALDPRLQLDVDVREAGPVRELEEVALVEVHHCALVARHLRVTVLNALRERPELAHLDAEELTLPLEVGDAVDRLEHREAAP